MAVAQRLNLSVDALAALGAELRVQTEDIDVPPEVRRLLGEVSAALGSDLLAGVAVDDMRVVADSIRTYFIQAAELLDDPGRQPGWVFDDPVVLQSQGGGSVSVARIICQFAPTLDGLTDRFDGGAGSFLDVGTGVARLAIEMATEHPSLRVVGIDPWRPALELAADNIAEAGFEDRIELREQRVEEIADRDTFDMVWLAGPFLAPEVTEPALARSLRALHVGGWVVLGTYAGPEDPLAHTLAALRTVRSGGRVLTADQSIELLRAAGFEDIAQIERTWPAPVDFVVARKP
jgi:predicted O-methyltransferase YrrM